MKKQKTIVMGIIAISVLLYGIQIGYSNIMKKTSIAIIGYHHIVPDEDKEMYYKNNMWVNSLSSFEAQMQYLAENEYQCISLDDLYAWYQGAIELPEKSVVITFDDGFYSSIQFAKPVLERYGFQASVFVIGSLIDNQRHEYVPSKRQHASIKDMQEETYLTFYSHSYDLHEKNPDFKVNMLSKAQLLEDTLLEKEYVDIRYYAYPYGRYNEVIQEVLKEQGVKLAFSYNENRKAKQSDDQFALPRFNVNAYTRLDVFAQMVQ